MPEYLRISCQMSLHIAAVAFNSLLFGEVVVPDWDMFYVSLSFLYIIIKQ